jgi:acetyl-CoA acetyltransferase
VQNEHAEQASTPIDREPAQTPQGDAYMAMLDTAEVVAEALRHFSRERQDEYALESAAPHRRRPRGRPLQAKEIAPMTRREMAVADKVTKAVSFKDIDPGAGRGSASRRPPRRASPR